MYDECVHGNWWGAIYINMKIDDVVHIYIDNDNEYKCKCAKNCY